MAERRRIVAMGGGGYSVEPDNPLLDQFVVELASHRRGRRRPTVCYLGTAGAALVFRGTALEEVVTSRPGARAFRVERRDGGLAETALATRFLGTTPG